MLHISVPIIHYSCHITEAESGLSPPAAPAPPPPSPSSLILTVLLLWFLTVTCSCCLYLYFGSAIMLVTYFSKF